MLVYVQNGPVLHRNDLKMRCMRPKKRPDQGDISLSDRLLGDLAGCVAYWGLFGRDTPLTWPLLHAGF